MRCSIPVFIRYRTRSAGVGFSFSYSASAALGCCCARPRSVDWMVSLKVAHAASAARHAAAHGTRPPAVTLPADTGPDRPRLEPQLAARHQFPDVLLPDPHLAVVREADEGHVHLVEPDLRVARGVDDGVDGPGQHEVGAELLAHRVARVLAGVDVLVLALVAYSPALRFRGDEVDLAGIDQRALHLQGERLRVDVLVAHVAHFADDHRGPVLPGAPAELLKPGARQRVLDHLLRHHAGVGVVPGPAQVYRLRLVEALHLGGARGNRGERDHREARAQHFAVTHFFSPETLSKMLSALRPM